MAAPQDLSQGTGRAGPALATEFLAGGTVLVLIAFACIMVRVRLVATSRADGRLPGRGP